MNVTVRPESEFFGPFSRFFMLTGWFRQQIIKLYVPAKLGFGGYLTLDSDVACVGDFDATTFVHEGKALSRWEPKRHHDWWRSAAKMVGVPFEVATHGLSVTPNILHGELAAQTLAHFQHGSIDPVTTLGFEVIRRLGTIPGRNIRSTPASPSSTATCSTIISTGMLRISLTPSSSRRNPVSGTATISSG